MTRAHAGLPLRTRLAFGLLLAGVFPVAVGGFLTLRDQEQVLRAQALADVQQTAVLLAARVPLFMNPLRDQMQFLAEARAFRAAALSGDWAAVEDFLDGTTRNHRALRGLLVADGRGLARAAAGMAVPARGRDVANWRSIALVRERRTFVVTEPSRSPNDGRPIVAIGVPIVDGDRVAAILSAAVDLGLLADEIRRVQVGTNGIAVVQTAEGRILVHRDHSRLLELAPEAVRATTLTRPRPAGAVETPRPGGGRDFTGFATVPDLGWVVVAHVPTEEALHSLDSLRRNTLTLVTWLLVLVGAFALVLGRFLSRPLNELAAAARALGAGVLGRRVAIREGGELGEVARAFNEMADRRQQAQTALQASLERLETLDRLSAAIAAGTDRAHITQQVVEAAARLLGTPYAVLWVAGPDRVSLTAAAMFASPTLGPLPPRADIPMAGSLAGIALAEGRPIVVPDVLRDPRWASPNWSGLNRLAAYVAVPLGRRETPVGILVAMDGPGRAFSEADAELLRSLGTHAALAIEKAAILEAERQAAAQAHALVQVGKVLTETFALDIVLARIAEKVMDLLQVSACGVGLAEAGEEGAGGVVRFPMVLGLPPAYGRDLRLSPDDGTTGRAVRERRPVWTADALNDPAVPVSAALRERMLAHGVPAAILAAPMLRGEALVGVLTAFRPTGSSFTPAEAETIGAVADQAAIAIQNAQLYTDLQAAYEKLAAAQEQALQVEKLRAMGEMASGLAHDFNNLLTAILGQAQLLKLQSADPHVDRGLGVIEQAALDGGETVRRLLGFARVAPDRNHVAVDLGSLLPQVLEVTRPRWKDEAQQRGAAIEATVHLDTVPPVKGDAAELREVLVNLIFNAVDAMPQGGRLALTARPGPPLPPVAAPGMPPPGTDPVECVEVSVQDTGIGMSEDVQRRAFNPFFTTKGPKGSGLGLSMVYGTVARLGGEVRLESRAGAGTIILLRLPAADPGAAVPAPADESRLPAAAGRRGHIVVVDDEEPLARLLAEMLRIPGHEVEVFTDPRLAVDHLARAPVDLLFTDLGMAEMSGWDVARRTHALRPDLPVILVTGWGHQTDPHEARARHVSRVVSKPYRMATILEVTADYLSPTARG